ncbi:PglZ domain-containing protein [Stigmatella aurantiaca]|uniref:PglZ domain-containing protein n=1 Tax=Stigmatella aurantiaca TaxID=41 RepID=A0A1H8EGK7_STIAU|nr:BREX-2 system phosphatase PglZ [Stigmatella aurantiaca]SEN18603.1 PglZ domain-containing protein [Stigmatella aurantiaca]
MKDALLRKIIELAGGLAERGYVLALDGEFLRDVPERLTFPRQSYSYTVTRPGSELALRRLIVRAGGEPFIALLDEKLAHRLPRDLVRRARGQRVHSVDVNDVLVLALGTPVVGADAETKELALRHLERLQEVMRGRTLPTVIDRRMLDELLLDACVGARIRSDKAGTLLATWLRELPRGEPALMSLLRRILPTLHGGEGRVLAWALEDSRRLKALVVNAALLAIEEEQLPPSIWGLLHGVESHPTVQLTPESFRATVRGLAQDALEALGEQATPYLAEAEALGRKALTPKVLEKSRLLPLGLDVHMRRLAEQAAKGEPIPGAELESLRTHRAVALKRGELEVLESLARLSRYVAEPLPVDGDLAARVRHYQESGAFADWAALKLRRALATTAEFQKEAQAVLAAYRARRDEENLAFARLLAEGYTRAIFAPGVVPLHRLWGQVASQARGEPLYVVVLDGCSYPVFLELLDELAQEPQEPLGLIAPGAVPLDRAHGVPALAPLPTVTSHARGALFLGEIPKDPLRTESLWREQEERVTDPARFRQNEALGARSRRLFLKGDLADGAQALLAALREPALEVVAAVFNAVDDQIGSANTGAAFRVHGRDIAGFIPSLKAALGAGRRVLLTADHGHTPYWTRELHVGPGASARWCELPAGAMPADGFIALDLEGLGGTPGRKAFAWKMGVHQGAPQVGFHGGCGLEEMVVPLAWLGRQGVAADEPAWWLGRTRPQPVEVARLESRPVPAPKPAAVAVPSRLQGDLFDARATVAAVAAGATALGVAENVLALLDAAERAALVVLAQNGSARGMDLAPRIGKPVGRVAGFMTQLHRKLHRVGVAFFKAETLPTGDVQYHHIPQAGAERP